MTTTLSAPSPADHHVPLAGAVKVDGVSKSFAIDGRNLEVLRDINVAVPAGGFLAIVGASGCGKSTLLRLIAGLETSFTGSITLDGTPITGPSLERGMVFQDHRLFPWLTVSENITLAFAATDTPRAVVERKIAEHLELVGLNGFGDAYPSQISGGMAQRAAIARALVNEPEVLLLDEPLGALDALTRVRLQKELERIWQAKGVTMILVTHDIDEAVFLADRIIVLEPRPGRIRRDLVVDLPHPRDRSLPAFVALRDEILAECQ